MEAKMKTRITTLLLLAVVAVFVACFVFGNSAAKAGLLKSAVVCTDDPNSGGELAE